MKFGCAGPSSVGLAFEPPGRSIARKLDPMLLAGLLIAVFGAAAVYFASKRAISIAELAVDRGVVRVVRGGVAPPILADLRDIAKRPPIDELRVHILRSSGRAEVQLVGSVSPGQAQQIRNVIGSVPLARLINAARR